MGKAIKSFRKKNHRKVYDDISKDLRKAGFKFTADELYAKKKGLDATFCKYRRSDGFVGPVKWEFYDAMMHFRGRTHTT